MGATMIVELVVALMVEGFRGAPRRSADPSMQISSPPLPSPGRSSPLLPWLVGGVPLLMGPVLGRTMAAPQYHHHGLCLN